jgi:lipid-binding SYLF domain-containing protein
MMKKIAAMALLSLGTTLGWAQETDHTERLQRATDIVQHMTSSAPDNGVPNEVLEGAKCVAVIPRLKKGAFGIGAEHGRGVATCRTAEGWSSPAPFETSGLSFGPQIGAKETDVLMFVMNDEGMNQLLSGHFKVGGDASVAAGPVGREGAAGAGWKAAILTYSNAKGAFIGASLNGAELSQDNSATKAWFGRDVPFKDILTGQAKSSTPAAREFVSAVASAKTKANREH